MAMRMFGPNFINWDARERELKYRITEHVTTYLRDWYKVFGPRQESIDLSFEQDLQHLGWKLKCTVGNWMYPIVIDDRMLDASHKDVHYLEYIREQCVRGCMTGITMDWLDRMMSKHEEEDVPNVFRNRIVPAVSHCELKNMPGVDHQVHPNSLCIILFRDTSIPFMERIDVIEKEPKLALARMLMII